MVFSSITFLTIFLPVVFILHTIMPGMRAKNVLLLIASLLFYAYGEPVYILLLLGSAAANYGFALWIGRLRDFEQAGSLGNATQSDRTGQTGPVEEKRTSVARIILAVAVIVNIGALVVFKYAGFLTEVVNRVSGLSLPVPAIRLPIGISFYTFQALSYVIDVYRKRVRAQRSFPKVLLYISFFPQLIAGPIVKYHDVEQALTQRSATVDDIHDGIRRFIKGLAKKVLIANTMAVCADALFARPMGEVGPAAAWIAAFSYLMQIYFDFSGYSDMAIGMGRMFGFHFRENFLLPYASVSVTDFWRRWHVSLSTWFKEYLYIPLGGNRKGKVRTVINKWIVFLFTGLWHGANVTFLFWGVFHGFFLMLEETLLKPFRGKKQQAGSEGSTGGEVSATNGEPQAVSKVSGNGWKWISHLYTMLVVLIGFVFFRADTMGQGFAMVLHMFGGGSALSAGWNALAGLLTPLYLVTALIALIWSGFLCPGKEIRPDGGRNMKRVPDILLDILSLAALVLCLLRLSGGTYNPFIYFRF